MDATLRLPKELLHSLTILQSDLRQQIVVLQDYCGEFIDKHEFDLAKECLLMILAKQEELSLDTSTTTIHINTLVKLISMDYFQVTAIKGHRSAPIGVSKLLVCLKQLRNALDILFKNHTKSVELESLAWIVMNLCKLIYFIGEPLLWISCGKYAMESLIFAAISMEAIINLCAFRHMKFRMKLFSSAFYACLVQGTAEEAAALLYYATKQYKELREREELDTPLPPKIQLALIETEMDISVMQCVLNFWKDPDSFTILVGGLEKFASPVIEDVPINYKLRMKSFSERCLCEAIRVHYLTAGNTNEPYKKRSTAIMKAISAYASSNVANGKLPLEGLTIKCLSEVCFMASFETAENVDAEAILDQVWSHLTDFDGNDSVKIDSFGEKYSLRELKFLKLLHSILKSSDEEENKKKSMATAIELMNILNEILNDNHSSRRKSMLRKGATSLWLKFIYPQLQSALSLPSQTAAKDLLEPIKLPLLLIFKVIDSIVIDDAVLFGSVTLIAGSVLHRLGDFRGAISLLRQGLESLEDMRACRVEVLLHLPDDARDVSALQRISFTTRPEAQDWFHSVKRLGAHAFAGFGIFGAGSSTDPSDQAIGDLHADILALYFRIEIEYSIRQKGARGSDSGIKADKLSCISALKAFCAKNSYARNLLHLEMAKVDSRQEEQLKLVEAAKAFIEEAEAREKLLKDSFSNLMLMTDKEPHHPIILARSHKFIYVAPVGFRKHAKTASHYRILAKEQGSGTELALSNNTYPGCEKNVALADMQSPSQCAVKVEQVKSGERYVFGCVAFSAEGKPVGNISPNTPPVEALNPLPTIALWANLTQTAASLGFTSISRAAGARICDRFFLPPPQLPVTTIGKGINLFLHDEPLLCTTAIHQSSKSTLIHFIRSFVTREGLLRTSAIGEDNLHWDLRSNKQIKTLRLVRKASVVATVAAQIKHQELIVNVVCLGYNHSKELLMFDEGLIAPYLQNAFSNFMFALQCIPKRHWHDVEHDLYSRISQHLVKMAVMNRNIGPALILLGNVYGESDDSESLKGALPSNAVLRNYLALSSIADSCGSLCKVAKFDKQISALFSVTNGNSDSKPTSPRETIGFLWSQTEDVRLSLIRGMGVPLLQLAIAASTSAPDDAKKVDGWLKELPEKVSDFIKVLASLTKELIRVGKGAEAMKLVSRYGIYDKYLSPLARELQAKFNLSFIQPLPPPAPPAAAQPPAKGAKGAKGAATASAPTSPREVKEVPDRFVNVSIEEEVAQVRALGEVSWLMASACFSGSKKRNIFPEDGNGPLALLDPYDPNSAIDINSDIGGKVESDQPISPRNSEISESITRDEFVRYLCASASIFSEMQLPFSATACLTKLWNFVVDEWMSPTSFSISFRNCQREISAALLCVIDLFEKVTSVSIASAIGNENADKMKSDTQLTNLFAQTNNDDIEVNGKTNLLSRSISRLALSAESGNEDLMRKSVKELLLISRDMVLFFVNNLWLNKQYESVVENGSRLMSLYMAHVPDLCKSMGYACFPLMSHAQDQLLSAAEADLASRQSDLDTFIFNYEEAQRKKKKKKLRIARVEKDEEELKFDADKAQLEDLIARADMFVRVRKTRSDTLNELQKKFETLYSTGVQLYDKVKKGASMILNDCRRLLNTTDENGIHKYPDFKSLLEIQQISNGFDNTLFQYSKLVDFLREKKEKVAMIDAMKDAGDLLILFGRNVDARSCWFDAIDGLFSIIDSCKNWHLVIEKLQNNPAEVTSTFLSCIPSVLVMLGKLCRHCSATDLDSRSAYSRFAASLSLYLFSESCCHPNSPKGFAAYICLSLGGTAAFALGRDKLDPMAFVQSLEELLKALCYDELYLEALPLVVLLEYFCGLYCRNASLWLSARTCRVRLLISSRLFAQAASMIAGIKPGLSSILDHTFGFPLRVTSKSGYTNADAALPLAADAFDTRETCLDFFGLSPFFGNLTVDHASNQLAITWILGYSTDFSAFAANPALSVEVPLQSLTESERLKHEEAIATAAAAAAEAEKKSKGKKAEPVVVAEPLKPTRKIISDSQLIDIQLLCAHFVIELVCADSRLNSKPNAATCNQMADKAESIVNKALDELLKASGPLPATIFAQNISFMALFSRCQLLRVKLSMRKFKLRDCRATLTNALRLLRHDSLSAPHPSVRAECMQLWFSAKMALVDVADRQSRFADAVALCRQVAMESAAVAGGFWLRQFLLKRALVQLKLGNICDAESDCDSVLEQYRAARLVDGNLVRACAAKASILHTKAAAERKPDVAYKLYLDCLKLLRVARNHAEDLARKAGFAGADANMTFTASLSVVSENELLPSALHNITEIHANNAALTLAANVTERQLAEVLGKVSTRANDLNSTTSSVPVASESLRHSVIDADEATFSQSPLANIYLRESHQLATMHSALCLVLDELRCSNLFSASDHYRFTDDEGYPAVLSAAEVLAEQCKAAEDGLKVLRYAVDANSHTRLSLLLSASKSRFGSVDKAVAVSSDFVLSPIRSAINIALAGCHSWEILKALCVQIIELYGDQSIHFTDVNVDARLWLAVDFFLLAVPASHQCLLITKSPLTLAADPAFTASATPAELSTIMEECASSSATVSTTATSEPAAESAGKGAAAKGKGAAANAASASASGAPLTGPNGRDALFLLSSLMREGDPIWTQSFERDLRREIHFLLKKSYPSYASQCCISGSLPDNGNNPSKPNVPSGSISTLWVPVRCPESNQRHQNTQSIYSYVNGYFLLGGKDVAPAVPEKGGKATAAAASASTAVASEPELTKVALHRASVLFVEKKLRDIRDAVIASSAAANIDVLKSSAYEFGELLELLAVLLNNGRIDGVEDTFNAFQVDDSATFGLPKSSDAPSMYVLPESNTLSSGTASIKFIVGDDGREVFVPFNEKLMLNLADVLTCNKDCEFVANKDLCAFLRYLVGIFD